MGARVTVSNHVGICRRRTTPDAPKLEPIRPRRSFLAARTSSAVSLEPIRPRRSFLAARTSSALRLDTMAKKSRKKKARKKSAANHGKRPNS